MRLFLAGGDNLQFLGTLLQAKAPYVLMSWWRIQKNVKRYREHMLKAKAAGTTLLVDSGAHSVYNEFSHLDPRQANKRAVVDKRFVKQRKVDSIDQLIAELDDFVDRYIVFLQENPDCYDHFAELDVDSLVGLEKVQAWRKKMVEAGLKPMPTFHNTDNYEKAGGTTAFLRGCADLGLDYVALSREGDHTFHDRFFSEHITFLTQNKIKIHLWGWTDRNAYRRVPAFSVDSSSWLNGSKYGTTHFWEPGRDKIHLYDYKTKHETRARMKQWCLEHGVDYQKFLDEDVDQVNLFHAIMWADFGRWLASSPLHPYWLDKAQVQQETDNKRQELGSGRVLKRNGSLPVLPSVQDPRNSIARFCNGCVLKDRCPEYKQDHECAFPALLHIEKPEDFRAVVLHMLSLEAGRVAHGVLSERLTGGHLDPNVSKEMRVFTDMMRAFSDLLEASKPRPEGVFIQATGPSAPGILSQMFGKQVEASKDVQ